LDQSESVIHEGRIGAFEQPNALTALVARMVQTYRHPKESQEICTDFDFLRQGHYCMAKLRTRRRTEMTGDGDEQAVNRRCDWTGSDEGFFISAFIAG